MQFLLKNTVIIPLLLFLLAIEAAYSQGPSDNNDHHEAQKLSNFISWYASLNVDPEKSQKKIFYNAKDGELSYQAFLDHREQTLAKIVVPLSGQYGIRQSILEQDKVISYVSFGERDKAPPMYVGNAYRFGVHAGPFTLKGLEFSLRPRVKVLVYDASTSLENPAALYEEEIIIPFNKFASGDNGIYAAFIEQWSSYLNQYGGSIPLGSNVLREIYGLESWFQYVGSPYTWVNRDGSSIILTHKASTAKFTYVVQIKGDTDSVFETVYKMSFSPSLPEGLSILGETFFLGEPGPLEYWKKYVPESMNLKFWGDGSVLKPEQYKRAEGNIKCCYPILDEFVSSHKDPLQLAAFVQNEIDLIDGFGTADKSELLKVIYPGKISRSPLMTFLEKQGSPWEQCMLLVYLLRQAGFAAAYVESDEPLIFTKQEVSKLFRINLTGIGQKFSEEVSVKYPWVAYYDDANGKWVHLFPWVKDTKIKEGYDLYGLMPEGYKSGAQWIRRYLENDPKILKHIRADGNDTAAVLFERFVEEMAKEKGVTAEKIGVQYQNRKIIFKDWRSFPGPELMPRGFKFIDSIDNRDDLFATVQLTIESIQNPSKNITTEPMRLFDIYNRALYIYFDPVSDNPQETRHNIILRMEGEEGFHTERNGAFRVEGLHGVQQKSAVLDASDKSVRINILYDQHMEEVSSYPQVWIQPKQEAKYTIDKGVLAAICINIGRVTKEMLDLHATRFTDLEKVRGSNSDANGRLVYLAGMSYFEKIYQGETILSKLHKIGNATSYGVGLSKLSPDFTSSSHNLNSRGEFVGKPILRFPQVDMNIFGLKIYSNRGIRPDLFEDVTSVVRDYYLLKITDGSSNEHQIINDFYNDKNAISTVKLLQLAHKRHAMSGKTGTGFLIFTRDSFKLADENPVLAKELYFKHLGGNFDLGKTRKEAKSLWDSVAESLHLDREKKVFTDDHDSQYSLIYMTPGVVYSDDGDSNDPNKQPSYKGMGAFIFTQEAKFALISGNETFMHGGYGSRLPEETFTTSNARNLDLSWDNGFKLEGITDNSWSNKALYESEINRLLKEEKRYFQTESYSNTMDQFSRPQNSQESISIIEETPNLNDPKLNLDDYFKSIPSSVFDNLQRDFRETIWGDLADKYDIDTRYGNYHNDENTFPREEKFDEFYKDFLDRGALSPEAYSEHQSWYEKVADPVDITSGAFQLQEKDLIFTGVVQLFLGRNYSSKNPYLGAFGTGWKCNFVPYLVLSPKDDAGKYQEGEFIQAAEIDGTVVVYRKQAENTWAALPEDNEQINLSGDDKEVTVLNSKITREQKGDDEHYLVKGNDGSIRKYCIRSFPIAGLERKRPYLEQIIDNLGNVVSFEYGNNKEQLDYGQVKRITIADGKFILLSYSEDGKIIKAETCDGRVVNYEYDMFGDLVTVTLPDDTKVRYTYQHKMLEEQGKKSIYSTNLLVREEKPNGRILENTYDDKGRVIEQSVSRLQGKLATNVTFTYKKDATKEDPIALREVKDAKGGVTQYKLYNSLITEITDPLSGKIYQSWYLDKETYWNAEKNQVETLPEGYSGLPNQLMMRTDKRGLKTYFSYDKTTGKITNKKIVGEDLSGDYTFKNFSQQYKYHTDGKLASVISDNEEVCFSYDDPRYPFLVTKMETKINNAVTVVQEFTYGDTKKIHGVLLAEKMYDPTNRSNKREINYKYNDEGLQIQRIQKVFYDARENSIEEQVTTFKYDLQGNLVQESIKDGPTVGYVYDVMSRPITAWQSLEEGEISTTSYYYNENGELEWIKGPAHKADYTLFNYDAAGNRVFKARWQFTVNPAVDGIIPKPDSKFFSSQEVELRQYDDLGRLIRIFDAEGHVIEYGYNALGQLVKMRVFEKLDGKLLQEEQYTHEPGGFIAKSIKGNCGSVERFYTTNGLIKREVFSDGSENNWKYDAKGRVVLEKTRTGAVWRLVYDDISRRVTATEKNTLVNYTKQYDIYGNLIEESNGEGDIVRYSYDSLGRLMAREINGETTKYKYNYQDGYLVKTQIDANNNRIEEITRTDNKLVQKLWYNSGSEESVELLTYFYLKNNQYCIVKGSDDTIKSCYINDPEERPLVKIYSSNDHIKYDQFFYGFNGQLVAKNDAESHISFYNYDALKRLVFARKYDYPATTLNYDQEGRLSSLQFPSQLFYNISYPSCSKTESKTIWVHQEIQETKNYKKDNREEYVDGNGVKVITKNDQLGSPLETNILNADGTEVIVKRTYDKAHRLTSNSRDDGKNIVEIKREYNVFNEITREQVLLGKEVIAELEQSWRNQSRVGLKAKVIKSKIFGEGKWRFAYNAANRLTKLEFANKQAKTYSFLYNYSKAGLLENMQKPWITGSLGYNQEGVPISLNIDGIRGESLAQELRRLLDGKIQQNHITFNSQTRQITQYDYKNGRLIKELTQVQSPDINNEGATDKHKEYDFDVNTGVNLGVLTNYKIFESTSNTLLYEHAIKMPQEYSKLIRPEVEEFKDSAGEKVDTLNTKYDKMGRVVERVFITRGQKQLLSWDALGNLLEVTLKDTSQDKVLSYWEALYDGFGRRVRTVFTPYIDNKADVDRKITQISIYDPEVEFLEIATVIKIGERDERVIWRLYGADVYGEYGAFNGHGELEAIVEDDTATIVGVVNDLLGNVIGVADETGKIKWDKEASSSYGKDFYSSLYEQEKASGYLARTVVANLSWRSKTIDPTGFVNFGARYYDPLTKKFLSADPLGHLSTPDLYSYANGDPINNIDPDGRFASEVYDYTGQAVNDFKDFSARTKDYYSSPPSYSWDDLGRDLQGLGPIGMEIGRGAQLAGEALNYLRAAEFLHRTGVGSAKNQDSNRAQTAGNYRPDRTLPRDKYGNPVPDSSEPHTQLGKQTGRSGEYTQAREWGKDGKLVKDVDFTDHMRPSEHPNPHQRRYIPNPTGGTPKRGKIEPLSYE